MAVIDPHYVWALGHIVMLLGSLYMTLKVLTFRGTPTFIYKLSYTGALLSYSIVVLKSLGTPRLDQAWLRRAFADENVQYAVLAVYWWVSKPVWLSIFPFAVFSLFHTLTFIRTNIIPKFVPPPPPTQAGQPRAPPALMENVSRRIQIWVKSNYDPAMNIVAYAELFLLGRLVAGALTWQSSLLAPIFLAHFIRLRYQISPFTREAIHNITSRIDGLVGNQSGFLKNGWETVKKLVRAWSGGISIPQGGAAPGAGAGAARPAGGQAGTRQAGARTR